MDERRTNGIRFFFARRHSFGDLWINFAPVKRNVTELWLFQRRPRSNCFLAFHCDFTAEQIFIGQGFSFLFLFRYITYTGTWKMSHGKLELLFHYFNKPRWSFTIQRRFLVKREKRIVVNLLLIGPTVWPMVTDLGRKLWSLMILSVKTFRE